MLNIIASYNTCNYYRGLASQVKVKLKKKIKSDLTPLPSFAAFGGKIINFFSLIGGKIIDLGIEKKKRKKRMQTISVTNT